jgi:predicted dehydrogenase
MLPFWRSSDIIRKQDWETNVYALYFREFTLTPVGRKESMPEELKLCMIGAGAHASYNIYPYFHFLKGGRVVANADLDIEKAKAIGSKFGINRSYSDYHEMLEKERPDGVLICVEAKFHARTSVELLNKGYHVYTEKPSSTSLDECRTMLAASKQNKRICMTAYKKRFAPAYVKARQIIQSPEFGKPVLLNLLRTKGPDKPSDDPNRAYMLQWGCHAIDLLTFLFGPIQRVSAIKIGDTPWAYAMHLQYASGAIGTFSVCDRIKARNLEDVTIIGSEGVVIKVDNSIEMIASKHNQPFAAHKGDFVNGSANGGREQGFVGELQAFVDAITSGQQPEANIEQGSHTMAVYEAIQKSASAGGKLLEVEAI